VDILRDFGLSDRCYRIRKYYDIPQHVHW